MNPSKLSIWFKNGDLEKFERSPEGWVYYNESTGAWFPADWMSWDWEYLYNQILEKEDEIRQVEVTFK